MIFERYYIVIQLSLRPSLFLEHTTSDSNVHSKRIGVHFLCFSFTLVWFDVLDDSEVVPSFEGSIICKVTRLPARCAKVINQKSVPKEKPQPSRQKISPAPTQTETQTSNSATSTDADMFFGSFVLFHNGVDD